MFVSFTIYLGLSWLSICILDRYIPIIPKNNNCKPNKNNNTVIKLNKNDVFNINISIRNTNDVNIINNDTNIDIVNGNVEKAIILSIE